MNEQKIREIFFKHLTDNQLGKALIETRKEISEELLIDALSGQTMDKEELELILRINDAHGRIGYFTPHLTIEIDTSQPAYFQHFIFIYNVWKELMTYMYDHYDSIRSEKFKEENARPIFKWIAEKIAEDIEAYGLEFASTGSIVVRQQQFLMIEQAFEVAMNRVLLGEEVYKCFTKRSDEAFIILRKYQHELTNLQTVKRH